MAFAGHELPLRLALLPLELSLLPPNPSQARDKSQPHRFIVKVQRRGHPHPTTRRVDAYVEILDGLVDDLDRYPTNVEAGACGFSSHAAP